MDGMKQTEGNGEGDDRERERERMKVTEGLGSTMLSIWLRDVLCLGTVAHEHRDYMHTYPRWGYLSLVPELN